MVKLYVSLNNKSNLESLLVIVCVWSALIVIPFSCIQKRVAPAVAAAAKEVGVEVAKEAIKESIEIAKEQGKKAEAFVDKKVKCQLIFAIDQK